MHRHKPTDINNFYIIGVNYRKTDASMRGKFAISQDQYLQLFSTAPEFGIKEFFVLSTCNRTEIYGFAESANHLQQLLCTQTEGNIETFTALAYIKSGNAAIEHLFNVSAGLDSQILGDYEIVGQIKQTTKLSKANGFIGTYLERIINATLQASKEIKNNTELSGGTVSVSFAAIQYIKEKVAHISDKKILLVGIGKIGGNTCKNLVDYLNTTNITLINRTESKAKQLAETCGLHYAVVEELPEQIRTSDIIIVATNAPKPIVLKEHVANAGSKLLIDLSIPYNIEESAKELAQITLLNVDELSKIKDETLQKRKAAIPKAKAIIAEHIADFIDWHQMRKNVPVLKAIKTKLEQLCGCDLYKQYSASHQDCCIVDNQKIQKIIDVTAVKLRQQNTRGCQYLEAINDYIN